MAGSDHTDAQIVRLLVQDGRMSFSDLGRAVGLSSHAVGQRVRRLLEDGTIQGFTAIVAPAPSGTVLDAVVDVRLLPSTAPASFERFVRSLDDVIDVWFVTGRTDFLVRLRCADSEALNDAVRKMRSDGGVSLTETRLIMRS